MVIDAAKLTASLRTLTAVDDRRDPGAVAALRDVTVACVDLFAVTGSGIMIADEQNITRYVAASNGPGRYLEQAESRAGEGVCTEAFIDNHVVDSPDVCVDRRWPRFAAEIAGHGVHAVLGVPVRLGAVPVGTLDVYRDEVGDWDDSERRALARYGDVVETVLAAALRAQTAGELADQLQYALDYRVVIERAVGYLMASQGIDSTTAFNRLRRAARSRRTKIGDIAERLLSDGRLPS